MRLFITRHGQIKPSNLGYIGSVNYPRGNPPISELGKEQARLLGLRLKKLNFNGLIYASPYYRALDTAQVIAEIVDCNIIPAPPLREIVKSSEAMKSFNSFSLERLKEDFSYIKSDAELDFPWWSDSEEAHEDVGARVAPFIDLIVEKGKDVLFVSHGACVAESIRYILKNYNNREWDGSENSWNCSLTLFNISTEFEAVCISDIGHLPIEMVTANKKTYSMVMEERLKSSLT